jgi:hypothetical protein
MKRWLSARLVLVLGVAVAAWFGGALAMAAVTLSDDVTKPKLLDIHDGDHGVC